LVVSYAKTRFTAIMPEAWLYALGGLFVLVTLLLPKGIAGFVPALIEKLSHSKQTKSVSNKTTSEVK